MGPDWDRTGVFFNDASGNAIKIELDNRRLNPVTIAEILEVLEIVVDDIS